MAEKWVCNVCNSKIESSIEPANCPCGSEKIEQVEEKSRLEQLLERFFGNKEADNKENSSVLDISK